jgi:ABC-2 type transport system permease protein
MIPLQYFSGIWMIHVIVERFQALAGWTFPQIAFLYGLGLISHGIQVAFFIPIWDIERHLQVGKFDRLKLRPIEIFFQLLCNQFNLIGLVDLIPAITIFVYGTRAVGFVWTAVHVLELMAVIGGGVLIRVGIYTMVGSIAFYTQRSRPLIGVSDRLFYQCTSYPLTIYPVPLQWVLTALFPAAFIAFYPAAAFLGKSSHGLMPYFLTALVGIGVYLMGMGVFYRGLRRYDGSGT